MTKTSRSPRKSIQLSLISAVFAVAGLMVAATAADAATRVNETQMNWNKGQFINHCLSQRSKIACLKNSLRCSCDDNKYVYIWRGNLDPTHGVVRLLRTRTSWAPGGEGGDRSRGRTGKP